MNAGARRATPVLTGLVLIAASGALLFGAGQTLNQHPKVAVRSDKISIHGHVRTPDGRPMPGVKLTLYSNAGQFAIDMNASTNQAGFYAFAVAKTLVGRTFQLTPSHPSVPSAPFSPQQRIFGLTANPGPLDFSYQGPLPDLTCSQANLFFEMEGASRHYYVQVTVLNRINNGQGLAAGPFKVRATYEDRTVDPWKMREAVFSVPGLAMGLTHVEGHLSIGVYPPQAFFRLVKVEVDIQNAVVESDEGNNTRTF
jgi:hypothetical protein